MKSKAPLSKAEKEKQKYWRKISVEVFFENLLTGLIVFGVLIIAIVFIAFFIPTLFYLTRWFCETIYVPIFGPI